MLDGKLLPNKQYFDALKVIIWVLKCQTKREEADEPSMARQLPVVHEIHDDIYLVQWQIF